MAGPSLFKMYQRLPFLLAANSFLWTLQPSMGFRALSSSCPLPNTLRWACCLGSRPLSCWVREHIPAHGISPHVVQVNLDYCTNLVGRARTIYYHHSSRASKVLAAWQELSNFLRIQVVSVSLHCRISLSKDCFLDP